MWQDRLCVPQDEKCNGPEKKKKRSSVEPKTLANTRVFARRQPTKGGRRLGCHRTWPQPSVTQNDLQRTKTDKNEKEHKNLTKLRRGQIIRNQRQTPHFTPEKQSQNLLHTSGVDLDESFTWNIVSKGDGTSNFWTSPDSGVWGPYKPNLYQKRG